MIWPPDRHIPDEDFLFTRISKSNILNRLPKAGAFKNTPYNQNSEVLSSDWEKYIDALGCRNSVSSQNNSKGAPKNPADFFVWKMNVGRIRKEVIPSQEVFHTPSVNNRAHTTIKGRKPDNEGVNNAEFRSIIVEIGHWAISP